MSVELKYQLLEFLEKEVRDSMNRPRAKLFDISLSDGGRLKVDNCVIQGFSSMGKITAHNNSNVDFTNSNISYIDPYIQQIMELILILKDESLDKSKLDIFISKFKESFGALRQAGSIIDGLTSLARGL